MKKILNRIPLPLKLISIGLIPIVLLAFLTFLIYKEKTGKIEIISGYKQRLELSSSLIEAANSLQVERRVSFTYTFTNTSRDELSTARNHTNESLKSLNALSTDSTINYILFAGLNQLNAIRDKIDSSNIKPADIMNYYSNSMLRLNSLSEIKTEHIPFLSSITSDLQGALLLSSMVTYMGIIRGNIYYSMYQNEQGPYLFDELLSLFNMYTYIETEFLAKATPATIDAYKSLINNNNFRTTIDNINRIIATGSFKLDLDAETWKAVSANAVDELSNMQIVVLKQLQDNISVLIENETAQRDKYLAFILLVLAFVLALLIFTMQNITSSLTKLSSVASEISLGDVKTEIPYFPKDALRSLANSIGNIAHSNEKLSKTALEIGQGNFDVVIEKRSGSDILSESLVKMRDNLQKFSENDELTIWKQNGINLINDNLKGDQEMNSQSAAVLATLAEYLNAEMGALYITRSGTLKFSAGYAIESKNLAEKEIKIGETLSGQVAATGNPVYLNNVPSDYFKISSALGEILPCNLYIIPLKHNNVVEGVLELASFAPFDKNAIELLEIVANDIAIAIQSEKNREQLQLLLEETQSQAEELQSQHSELENLNQALEAQTDRLQVSEEELKVQQEELLQANKELEERSSALEELNQMVMERNQEVQEKAEQLELSSKYKSEFLANMSHELRTPLNSILLLSRLMSDNYEGNLTDEQIEHARVIQNSGEGLLTMIDEILDLSKIEAGKMKLEPSYFTIEEVTTGLKSLFQPIANQKNLDFTITIEENLPDKIHSDKLRLEQILRNILSNAFKFTSRGGVTLKVKKEKNHTIGFYINDTGIGISKDKQAIIFEAFQQADGSTRRNYGGSGLGLSISTQLAQLLNGIIAVTSHPGTGSEFRLVIPVNLSMPIEETQPTVKSDKNNKAQQATNFIKDNTPFVLNQVPAGIPDDRDSLAENDRTILIVEDDMNFAKSILNYTHQRGYKGIVVPRGDDAFSTAKKLRPLAILLDIQLPVKSGWEVMEELKSDAATKNIPIHIMSSYEVRNESIGLGASNFIRKEEAIDKIREIFKELDEKDSATPKKLLIVEDNSMHARALQFFLNEYKIPTAIASSYQEVHHYLTESAFNYIIIDSGINHPEIFNTIGKVKSLEGFENIPVIIVTNNQISRTDELRIKKIAKSIIIKTAHSFERVLDELSIFLHVLEEGQEKRLIGRTGFNNTLTEILGNKKILVVDDDVRNIFSLTKALEQHKMQVYKAIDGKEALEVLENNPDIDLVLLDIMMPVMDGFETLKHLRNNPAFEKLPVIAVTAKAMSGDREACINAGASDYISKPIDTDQLLSLLRVWLYNSRK